MAICSRRPPGSPGAAAPAPSPRGPQDPHRPGRHRPDRRRRARPRPSTPTSCRRSGGRAAGTPTSTRRRGTRSATGPVIPGLTSMRRRRSGSKCSTSAAAPAGARPGSSTRPARTTAGAARRGWWPAAPGPTRVTRGSSASLNSGHSALVASAELDEPGLGVGHHGAELEAGEGPAADADPLPGGTAPAGRRSPGSPAPPPPAPGRIRTTSSDADGQVEGPLGRGLRRAQRVVLDAEQRLAGDDLRADPPVVEAPQPAGDQHQLAGRRAAPGSGG